MTNVIIGSHRPSWLTYPDRPELMVSRNTMPTRRLPSAAASWVLDSGGFTELSMHGGWRLDAVEYSALVGRYWAEIGQMRWAAPQDWMCEPFMLAKTGLTVAEHQRRTTNNYLELRSIDAGLPIIPVLQGWTRDDYLRHADEYSAAGVDLTWSPVVGVGSVCRRQHTDEAVDIFRSLHELGLSLHGFGLKAQGIARAWPYLTSCDSMAWSYDARRVALRTPRCGRVDRRTGKPVKSCANCYHYAIEWWERATSWAVPIQGVLEDLNKQGAHNG